MATTAERDQAYRLGYREAVEGGRISDVGRTWADDADLNAAYDEGRTARIRDAGLEDDGVPPTTNTQRCGDCGGYLGDEGLCVTAGCPGGDGQIPHPFTPAPAAGEPSRVRYGQEDIPHCATCDQAEDRPIHRDRPCAGCGQPLPPTAADCAGDMAHPPR